METNVRYAIVGAFVIVMISMIFLAVIWLASGFGSDKKYNLYKVYMAEAVSGLTIDAPVEYNGVNVGKVKSIKIDPFDTHIVDVVLRIKDGTPITLGTRAKLDVRSLSGIAYIALEDKGTDKTPLTKLPGEEYPVIQTTPSIFMRLDSALTQLNNSFTQLSASIKSLLSDENLHALKLILHSGQGTLQMIQSQTIPSFNHTMDSIDEITNNLNDVTSEMKDNPAVIIRGRDQNTVLGPGEK